MQLRLKVFDPETFQLVKNVSVNFGAVMEGIDMRGLFINNIIDYDGRLWLSVQKYLVCLDKESLIPLRVLPGHSLTITAIVGYENRIWTCSEDCSVRVWDSRTYECLQTFSDFGGKLFTMIRSGSSLWMAGWDGSISIYSGKTCQLVKNLEQKHQDAISCFALGLDSVWAGSWDGSISVWG
jgi:WD40 repeat protein